LRTRNRRWLARGAWRGTGWVGDASPLTGRSRRTDPTANGRSRFGELHWYERTASAEKISSAKGTSTSCAF